MCHARCRGRSQTRSRATTWPRHAGGRLLPQPRPSQRSRITPGSFFLRLATHGEPFEYAHTGIVVDAAADTFKTIEGNTNDDGSYGGF
jgi:hypothetical protein